MRNLFSDGGDELRGGNYNVRMRNRATNPDSCLILIWELGLGVEIGSNVSGVRVVFLRG